MKSSSLRYSSPVSGPLQVLQCRLTVKTDAHLPFARQPALVEPATPR